MREKERERILSTKDTRQTPWETIFKKELDNRCALHCIDMLSDLDYSLLLSVKVTYEIDTFEREQPFAV
jgi:predicted transcriptional regulator